MWSCAAKSCSLRNKALSHPVLHPLAVHRVNPGYCIPHEPAGLHQLHYFWVCLLECHYCGWEMLASSHRKQSHWLEPARRSCKEHQGGGNFQFLNMENTDLSFGVFLFLCTTLNPVKPSSTMVCLRTHLFLGVMKNSDALIVHNYALGKKSLKSRNPRQRDGQNSGSVL